MASVSKLKKMKAKHEMNGDKDVANWHRQHCSSISDDIQERKRERNSEMCKMKA